MKLVTLSKEEFKKFADKHEQITFHQTTQWADLKLKTGWIPHYIGLEENKNIIGGALILAKKLPIIKKKILYSPRGFLIDYKNNDVLKYLKMDEITILNEILKDYG